MPTEIVLGDSNPREGRISINDLQKITNDFVQTVTIGCTEDRVVEKIDVISIPVVIIQNLLDELTDEEKLQPGTNVNIRFGLTLPGQKDCLDEEKDVSNHLTVALLLEKAGTELNGVGDFVITAGFKEQDNGAGDALCCPVIKPGGGQ
jgi:hypothetical protein